MPDQSIPPSKSTTYKNRPHVSFRTRRLFQADEESAVQSSINAAQLMKTPQLS
jgi:hypothetical protein